MIQEGIQSGGECDGCGAEVLSWWWGEQAGMWDREEGNNRCQSKHGKSRFGEWMKEMELKETRRQGQSWDFNLQLPLE